MGGLAWYHWVIVIAVGMLLFGAKRLPDAARSLGQSMRIFKAEIKGMQDDDKHPAQQQGGVQQPVQQALPPVVADGGQPAQAPAQPQQPAAAQPTSVSGDAAPRA